MGKSSYKAITLLLLMFFLAVALVISAFSMNKYMQDTRHQFFCENLRPGMLKDEVKRNLDKYGTYSWRDHYVLAGWSYVYFDRFIPRIILGNPVVLRFDSTNKLLAVGSREKVGDEIQINCKE
jgi:hypothetical protein